MQLLPNPPEYNSSYRTVAKLSGRLNQCCNNITTGQRAESGMEHYPPIEAEVSIAQDFVEDIPNS
jgi:hypothetical protein